MSYTAKAASEVGRARTWTERVYLVSPLLLAAMKDIAAATKLAERWNRQTVEKMGATVVERNQSALRCLEAASIPLVVQSGPFSGLAYDALSTGSLLGAKILGCYEAEIGHWFKAAIDIAEYDTFIDVGCAEGYYAVGMATKCLHLSVYAFDINESAQMMTEQLAARNHVNSRLTVGGECSPRVISELLKKSNLPLVLVDIEGHEDEFLDPELVPELRYADIIVELHEFKRPGLTYRLLSRFADSHEIEAVAAVPDPWKSESLRYSHAIGLSVEVVAEGRHRPQIWLRMRAHYDKFGSCRSGKM